MDSDDIGYKIFRHIYNYSLLNIVILGFIGNFLCLKMFTSTKLNKYPISIYFSAISIFDSAMLVYTIYFYIKENSDFNMKHVNNGILCKFWFYFWYATGPISAWLMVIVSLDRFLTIVFPRQFSLIHKSTVQIAVIFSIAAYNYLLYSSMIWNTEIKTCNNKLFDFCLKSCYCFKLLIE